MKKKPKVGDLVKYRISNNQIGTGLILDPLTMVTDIKERKYYEREKYVLIEPTTGITKTPFWKRYNDLIE